MHKMVRRSRTPVVIATAVLALVSPLSIPTSVAQELLHTFPAGRISGHLAFSADDQLLAGVGETNNSGWVAVWEVGSGKEVARLPFGRNTVDEIIFVPGDKQLALLDLPRGSITLWEFMSGNVRRLDVIEPESKGSLSSFAFSANGALVAVAANIALNKSAIRVLQVVDSKHLADLKIVGPGRQIVFGGHSDSLAVAEERYDRRRKRYAAYVHEWDIDKRERREEWGPFPMSGTLRRGRKLGSGRMHLSPDARMLATTRGNHIVVIEVATGRQVTAGPHPSIAVIGATGFGSTSTCLTSLAFAPRGYTLATGANGAKTVWLWPIAGSASPKRIEQPELDEVHALKYSPSGKLLAAGSISYGVQSGGKVHVWRLTEVSETVD